MKTIVVSALLLVLLSGISVAQGIVRPKEQREGIIGQGSTLLVQEHTPVRTALADLQSPFQRWVDPTPAVTDPEPTVTQRQPRSERLPDAEALELIAERFRPTGSMIGAGTAFLNLQGGNRLELGQVFSATVRGESYDVIVERITNRAYTLRAGEATLTREYLQDRLGTGTMTRPGERGSDEPRR
ncbi:MAG: hypothetical protein JJU00_12020 [Opitutales bacterium]|nr:hypothetical protein [Opitutales bacterium]